MPTQILSVGDASVFVRFKEPYVSEGLNKKLHGLIGSGVVRGGRLQTGGVGFNLNIVGEAEEDSTLSSVYSYQDVGGRQFTIRQAGLGPVTLNLAPFAGQTIYIALYVSYTLGSTTVCEWRAYTEAELFTAPVAEAPYVIVLGRVVVPGAGPIPAANITPQRRRVAWDDAPAGKWHQVILNGDFEHGPAAGALATSPNSNAGFPAWIRNNNGSNPQFYCSTTAPYQGTREFRMGVSPAIAVTVRYLAQRRRVRVRPGQLVRGRARMRGSLWTGAATQGVVFLFYDNDLTLISTQWASDATLTGTFAYTAVDGFVEAPANAAWVRIGVGFDNGGAVLGTGDLYFDDVRGWVEAIAPLDDAEDFIASQLRSDMIELAPESAATVASMSDYVSQSLMLLLAGRIGGTDFAQMLMRDLNPFQFDLYKGQLKVGQDMDDETARIVANAGANVRTLLWESAQSGYTEKLRIYIVRDENVGQSNIGIEFTINARWDSTANLWMADNTAGTARKSAKLVFANTIFALVEMNMTSSVAAGWLDELTADPVDSPRGWDYAMMMLGGDTLSGIPVSPGGYETGAGKLVLENGSIHFYRASSTESNPNRATAIAKNTLYAKNIIKSWGRYQTGVANPTFYTLGNNDGFNFSSARQFAANSEFVEVNLATEVDDYVPIPSTSNVGTIVTGLVISPTQFLIGHYDGGTGAALDVDGFVATEGFAVVGVQLYP